MLTDHDIHRIVGLLTMISGSDDIQVELGTFVYDEASKSKRDIDITILFPGPDGLSALKGIEVKNHTTRPLDSTHVEQLVQKMNDMPDLKERGIVSASGYTKPAVKKARYHGIELYELADWDPQVETFDFVIPGEFPFSKVNLEWAKGPNVTANPKKKESDQVREAFKSNPPVRFGEDLKKDEINDLKGFADNIVKLAQNKIFELSKDSIQEGVAKKIHLTILPEDSPRFWNGDEWELIEEVRVLGIVHWVRTNEPVSHKILRKHDDEKPISSCAITESKTWGLLGISFSGQQRTVNIVHIPVALRKKSKVIGEKLKIERVFERCRS